MTASRIVVTAAVALATLSAAGCTRRFYQGPSLSSAQIAVIHVSDASVRSVDGRFGLALALGTKNLEVAPGPHRIVLSFERTARTIGLRDMPAQRGEGFCTVAFVAEAGKQYWIGARPLGTDWTMRRWDGKWEAWIRDPSVSDEADMIARCTAGTAEEEAPPIPEVAMVPTPAIAPAANPAPANAAPPVPAAAVRAPAATAPAPLIAGTAPPIAGTELPSAPSPPTTRATGGDQNPIRLGTWNLSGLGAAEGRDYAAIAAVIEANFDILTLTEVAHTGGGHPGYDRLIAALGAAWAGLVTTTPRPALESDDAEHYAIVYRVGRVQPCLGWQGLPYVVDNDGGPGGSGPDRFRREPAFACFEAGGGDSAPGVDFMLAVYRAIWADGDADTIATELAHLDEVFTAMSAARPGEEDLIIAGQLNLDSAELPLVSSAADRTQGSGSALNLLGEPAPGLRDHILVRDNQATAEMIGDGTVLDVRTIVSSPGQFRRTVSDHLPVMVRIRSSGPDDD